MGEFDELFKNARLEVERQRLQEARNAKPTIQDVLLERQKSLRLASVAAVSLRNAGVYPDKIKQPTGMVWELYGYDDTEYDSNAQGTDSNYGTRVRRGHCMSGTGELYPFKDGNTLGVALGTHVEISYMGAGYNMATERGLQNGIAQLLVRNGLV